MDLLHSEAIDASFKHLRSPWTHNRVFVQYIVKITIRWMPIGLGAIEKDFKQTKNESLKRSTYAYEKYLLYSGVYCMQFTLYGLSINHDLGGPWNNVLAMWGSLLCDALFVDRVVLWWSCGQEKLISHGERRRDTDHYYAHDKSVCTRHDTQIMLLLPRLRR